MDIILKGIITGFFLSIFVGATFFMLIETSMTRGFKAALWFDAGVVLCDAAIIGTVYFFTAWINRILVHSAYFNFAGGLLFMGFGINYILSRKREGQTVTTKNKYARIFMNGFFINLLNPSVIIFWLGSVAIVLSQFRLSGHETFVYYCSALSTVLLTDWLKAYFAFRLSRFLNGRVLRVLYVFSGMLMIGLGIYIMFN
jgi:threonine/homoserine/homoserine lactone efflux protein